MKKRVPAQIQERKSRAEDANRVGSSSFRTWTLLCAAAVSFWSLSALILGSLYYSLPDDFRAESAKHWGQILRQQLPKPITGDRPRAQDSFLGKGLDERASPGHIDYPSTSFGVPSLESNKLAGNAQLPDPLAKTTNHVGDSTRSQPGLSYKLHSMSRNSCGYARRNHTYLNDSASGDATLRTAVEAVARCNELEDECAGLTCTSDDLTSCSVRASGKLHHSPSGAVSFLKPIKRLPEQTSTPLSVAASAEVVRNIHAFYYMWYGSPAVDGRWAHWNHEYIPHWNKQTAARFPHGRHEADEGDIGSTFWPALGPYSSRNRTVTRLHMCQMRNASIGVAALSWYPSGLKDDHGMHDHEELLTLLLDEAAACNVEISIHIEPYRDRTPSSVREDLKFLISRHGNHPALHKRKPEGRHRTWLSADRQEISLPVIYVYDSYQNSPQQWAQLLEPKGSMSIRGTDADAIVICLWVEKQHSEYLVSGGFDGAYTYFASDGFVYGSTPRHWPDMASLAAHHGAFFVPSVGPGYDDTKVRPWNGQNTKGREEGRYFDRMFTAATKVRPAIISLTSWNEWHEGTNLEPAVPKPGKYKYKDYGREGPDAYLQRVQRSVAKWSNLTKRPSTSSAPCEL